LAVDAEQRFEQAVSENQQWIRSLAQQYARRSIYHDVEDMLFNEGLRALWESWRKYDPDRDAGLKTFAWKHVEGAIKDAIIEENTVWWAGSQHGPVLSLDAKSAGERGTPLLDLLGDHMSGLTESERVDLHLSLARVLSQLPESDQVLLSLRFVEDMSMPQIAEIMGSSVSHIWKLLERAFAKLRRRIRIPEKERADMGDTDSGGDAP